LTKLLWDRGAVHLARFSPDGQRLLTTPGDGKAANLWDITTGKIVSSFDHGGRLRFAAFSPDGLRVVTGGEDNIVRLWDAGTCKSLTHPLMHENIVDCAEFSADGRRLVTASWDKTARVWDVEAGRMVTAPLFHNDELQGRFHVQFSLDGHWIATSAGNVARIWDARTGAPRTPPIKHDGRVNSVRFSPDDLRFVTACDDGTARLWDAVSGHALSEPLRHGGAVHYAEISPDGLRVVTASADKTARIWDVPLAPMPAPDWLPELAEAVAGQRVDAQDMSRTVPVAALFQMRARIASPPSSKPQDSGIETNDTEAFCNQWAQWFFSDTATRTLSAWSSIPLSEQFARLVNENTFESLQEAAQFSSLSATLMARLASRLAQQKSTSGSRIADEADWFSKQALKFSPRQPELWLRRAEVLQALAQPAEASDAVRRAMDLSPTDPFFWRDAGVVLERSGRLNEALDACDHLIAETDKAPEPLAEVLAAGFSQRAQLLLRMGRIDEARADFLRASEKRPLHRMIPPRDPTAGPHLLDLTAHYNASLTENRGFFIDTDDWNYAHLPTGLREFDGVQFDVRGIVQAGFETADGKVFPVEVRGIPVGQRLRKLYFLHAAAAGEWLAPGAAIGHYLVRYDDGSEEKIHIVLGRTVGHGRMWPKEFDTKVNLVWLDPEETLRQAARAPRLFQTTWDNPHPDRRVLAIDLVSTWKVGGPFVVAITADPAE
jgi:WD40 repeat protein